MESSMIVKRLIVKKVRLECLHVNGRYRVAIVRGERCAQLKSHARSMKVSGLIVEEVAVTARSRRREIAGILVHEVAEGKGVCVEN